VEDRIPRWLQHHHRCVVRRVAVIEGRLVWFGGSFTAGMLFWTSRLAYDKNLL